MDKREPRESTRKKLSEMIGVFSHLRMKMRGEEIVLKRSVEDARKL